MVNLDNTFEENEDYSQRINDILYSCGYEYKTATYTDMICHYLNTSFNIEDDKRYSIRTISSGAIFVRGSEQLFKWEYYTIDNPHKILYEFFVNEITILKLEMLEK
jgi:hypothetical protein